MNELEKERVSMVLHELRAPLLAIRSNIAFLQSRIGTLDDQRFRHKLSDMSLDAELVLAQLSKLARVCGCELVCRPVQ